MRSLILPVIAGAMLLFATHHVLTRQQPIKQSAPPFEPAHSSFERQIAAAGLVEARSENIQIGSQIAGLVDQVFVTVDQTVRPGDPLFSLDRTQIDSDLETGAARLAAAEAELTRLEQMPRPEDLPPIEAQRREMEARVAEARENYTRTAELFEKKVATPEELTARRALLEIGVAQLDRIQSEEARLKAGAWVADKQVARAAVARARAELNALRTERDRLTIKTPPLPGRDDQPAALVVLQVNVRPGEAVAVAGSKALVVLGDIRVKHVRVDIDEHDIGRFQTTAPAVGVVRGNSSARYPLTFVRVEPYVIPKRSLTGDNTERVDTRVLQVLYRVNEDGHQPTYIGQQMDVFIDLNNGATAKSAAKTRN